MASSSRLRLCRVRTSSSRASWSSRSVTTVSASAAGAAAGWATWACRWGWSLEFGTATGLSPTHPSPGLVSGVLVASGTVSAGTGGLASLPIPQCFRQTWLYPHVAPVCVWPVLHNLPNFQGHPPTCSLFLRRQHPAWWVLTLFFQLTRTTPPLSLCQVVSSPALPALAGAAVVGPHTRARRASTSERCASYFPLLFFLLAIRVLLHNPSLDVGLLLPVLPE